jgi:hypothetical protein
MTGAILGAMLALSLGQAGSQAYTGTWTAEFDGKTYVRLELKATDGTLAGRISLGNIQLDKKGDVNKAEDAPPTLTPIFDVRLRDRVLSFSHQDSHDTDHFELRLVGNTAAELRFLPTAEDLKELAKEGIPAPKPIRLKKGASWAGSKDPASSTRHASRRRPCCP